MSQNFVNFLLKVLYNDVYNLLGLMAKIKSLIISHSVVIHVNNSMFLNKIYNNILWQSYAEVYRFNFCATICFKKGSTPPPPPNVKENIFCNNISFLYCEINRTNNTNCGLKANEVFEIIHHIGMHVGFYLWLLSL